MKYRLIFKNLIAAILVSIVGVVGSATTHAACLAPNNTELTLKLPNYPFWKIVAAEMEQCGNVKADFDFDTTSVSVDATNPEKNLGNLVGVSNASLYRLSKQNLLRPLDDLVAKYQNKLAPRQLIRRDGKVVAIAVAANTKALMVHEELFNQEGVKIPKTYTDFLASAEKLKGSQLYTHSYSLAFKKGWHGTQEFIDLYLSAGGTWLDEQNNPNISEETGVATLELMAKLTKHLPEEYLEADAAKVLDDLLKFRAPMAVTWLSSAGPLEDPSVSRVAGKMAILPAPAGKEGGKPGSTLWWDGFAIPASASDEQAEAAFRTALEGLDAEMLETHRDRAFWLVKEYVPSRLTKDILTAVDSGMIFYPASEATDLLRRALGPKIVDFLEGKKAALAALKEAEADYLRAAKERGLIGS